VLANETLGFLAETFQLGHDESPFESARCPLERAKEVDVVERWSCEAGSSLSADRVRPRAHLDASTGKAHDPVVRAVVAAVAVLALSGSAPAAPPRATADRPDEVRGPQLHAIYAVPSDGVDRQLDVGGAIESSVASFQRWLAAETGGARLREDTFQGSLDVTFVRLPLSDAEVAARGAFVRDELERLLRASGHVVAGKLYAVYYDGSSTHACGGGAWPPALAGSVAAMYLRGRPPGAAPCDTNSLAAPGAPPGYLDYAMLHELLHTLGAVPTCAPHHHLAGHTSDRPDDIMWAGSGAWMIPGRLDPGHDDYYGHGRSDCFDLARSPYLTSVAPPAPKPPPPPALAAGKPTFAPPRAGRTFTVRLSVTLGGAPAPSARALCSARLGRRGLTASGAAFARGRVTCRWPLPATARGRRIAGSVGAVVQGRRVTRPFSATVR
jgi:hypothetical protein